MYAVPADGADAHLVSGLPPVKIRLATTGIPVHAPTVHIFGG